MKLSYDITEAEYLNMLTAMLKRAERTPMRIAAFLMLTIVQMCWVGCMLLTADLSHRDMAILGALSAVLALINILFRALRRVRAKNALKNMKASGQILPDYWKAHALTVKGGEISLTFGGIKLVSACLDIGPVATTDGLLLLYSGGKIFEAVPVRAFPSDGAKNRFIELLKESAETAEEPFDIPEGAVWALRYETDGRDFLLSQVRCFRAVWLSRNMLKPFPIIKLAASVYMLYYAVTKASLITGIFLTLFVIAINLTAIIVLSPAAKFYLLRKVPALHVPESGAVKAEAYFTGDKAYFRAIGKASETRLREASLCRALGRDIAVYFGAWPALVIPPSAFKSREEGDKFVFFVKARMG
ncbi:MAG: hypothetical protein AB7C97_11730 [Oscillospiraceae bacterium]